MKAVQQVGMPNCARRRPVWDLNSLHRLGCSPLIIVPYLRPVHLQKVRKLLDGHSVYAGLPCSTSPVSTLSQVLSLANSSINVAFSADFQRSASPRALRSFSSDLRSFTPTLRHEGQFNWIFCSLTPLRRGLLLIAPYRSAFASAYYALC